MHGNPSCGPDELREGFDGAAEFHPVVGGVMRASTQFTHSSRRRDHNGGPSSGTGIPFSSTVCEHNDGASLMVEKFLRHAGMVAPDAGRFRS